MVIIGALIILFLVFFFLKKHVGPTILASLAGYTVYTATIGFLPTLHSWTNLPTKTLEIISLALFVVVLPLVVYIFSNRNWSPMPIRLVTAVVASAIIISFASGITDLYSSVDALGKNILNLATSYRGIIDSVGLLIAYIDLTIFKNF